MAYVYRHIRLDTMMPFYIGISSNDSNKYKRSKVKQNKNTIWNKIVNKCGGYRIDIILDDITWEEAIEKEIEFISLYGRLDKKTGFLANRTDGGEGSTGIMVSEETRLKLSIQSKGDNHYLKKSGLDSPLKGRKLSDDHKKKLSLAWEKRKINHPYLDATRHKISIKHSGSKHHQFNKSVSEEVKIKISNKLSGKNSIFLKHKIEVYRYGRFIGIFNGGGEVAKKLNLRREGVYNILRKPRVVKSGMFLGYSFVKIKIKKHGSKAN